MAAAFLPMMAHADIVLPSTRIVYPASSREVGVQALNKGKRPVLVQAWLDIGNASAKPEDVDVPFTLTPPVFRVEPGKGQTMRLRYTQEPLPQDRESVYWLNVLEIPPKAEAPKGESLLQLAYRTRIKVFFRPAGLRGRPDEVPAQIKWTIRPGENDEWVLHADNPAPYAVSFGQVSLRTARGAVDAGQGMVEAFKSADFSLKNTRSRPEGAMQVNYSVVNDYGASSKGTASVQ
ncbi:MULTISPECIES: fimbria/pilus periplasmic chaperone [unclassified Burkholderia]|nr:MULTISPECIES: fimbria/pilus periplasmic chaperone [unclassified Burkholderia]AOJ73561.1 hypothetical protein WS78_32535 [Burkholderia savannae]KVG86448.1 hypothetical protein WS81_29130 [Burkholderia sp. MSMB2040]KVG91964.1 hypothetical protein WS83_12545 [Burkholderia sp. MSMB2042]KVH00979.1 hypothetical protein WS82_22520 [Burkholderia sp. MSMB2041]KVG38490.1 hypothetical protein WS77_21040 [Burkholderia sp. MSMB0265]